MTDDSPGVSSQETQKCCKCDANQFLRQCQFEGCQKMAYMNHREWIARDAVSNQWCCHCCMPRAVKCYNCQRNGTQVLLFECEESGCNHRVCGVHWMGESGASSSVSLLLHLVNQIRQM
eukprot:1174737-Amphidinium_carterae.1